MKTAFQRRIAGTFVMLGWIALAVQPPVAAQSLIVPDDTLGDSPSFVLENLGGQPVEAILGGVQRGPNLFHSFRELNVDAGRTAYFFNPDGVTNILSRVTGTNPSNILGRLGVLGTANLFLVNPNGIVFGAAASLDVQGSFVATTATGLRFGDRGSFNATNPTPPSDLLTINPSAFFFDRATAAIRNSSSPVGLFAGQGQSLILLGGDVIFDGGQALALGGNLNVGGVAGQGTVELLNSNGLFQLSFSTSVPRADVGFQNQAGAGVIGDGQISIYGRNVLSDGGSILFSLLPPGSPGTQTADININATENLTLTNDSRLTTTSLSGSGNIGNIMLRGQNVNLSNGSLINASTIGRGNAGAIDIQATDTIALTGTGAIGGSRIASLVTSTDGSTGVGRGGDINLIARRVILADNAVLSSSNAFAQGDAGNIRVTAAEALTLSGRNTSIQTATAGQGNSGSVFLASGNTLSILRGANIETSTLGQGNAGNVTLNAQGVLRIDGNGERTGVQSAVIASQRSTNSRRAGNITINAGDLLMNSFALVSTQVNGGAIGIGGNINLRVGSLTADQSSELQSGLLGRGRAGNIRITANNRILLNRGSSAFTFTGPDAVGNGGTVSINARSLTLSDRSQIRADAQGRGNAGNLFIRAGDRTQLNSRSILSSAILGQGNAGNLQLNTANLFVLQGSQLLTLTAGRGSAGSLRLNARQRVVFDGAGTDGLASGAFSTVEQSGEGRGGNIFLTANTLSLTNGGQLVSATRGRGNAGNIQLTINDSVQLRNGGLIRSGIEVSGVGEGGDIDIRTRTLSVTDSSQVSALVFRQQRNPLTGQPIAGGRGNGGDIRVVATDSITLSGVATTGPTAGFSSGLLTLSERGASGRAGSITVNTGNLTVSDGAIITAASFNSGGTGGDIVVNSDRLSILNGGQILTNTRSSQNAGSMRVNVSDQVEISGRDPNFDRRVQLVGRRLREVNNGDLLTDVVVNESANSGLFASTSSNSSGNGGTITVNTRDLLLNDNAAISARSAGTGTAGALIINATDDFLVASGNLLTEATRSSGGDILINSFPTPNSGFVLLRGNSNILTNSRGNGGNITIQGDGIIAFDDTNILARSQDARGGNITLGLFFSETLPIGSQFPFQNNGRVDINADGQLAAGIITFPDTRFIQNSLNQLSQNALDTNTLLANSCIARRTTAAERNNLSNGRFLVTGSGSLPETPGTAASPTFSVGEVRALPESEDLSAASAQRSWQVGDPIVEPQGVYQLPNGELVLSRECT